MHYTYMYKDNLLLPLHQNDDRSCFLSFPALFFFLLGEGGVTNGCAGMIIFLSLLHKNFELFFLGRTLIIRIMLGFAHKNKHCIPLLYKPVYALKSEALLWGGGQGYIAPP